MERYSTGGLGPQRAAGPPGGRRVSNPVPYAGAPRAREGRPGRRTPPPPQADYSGYAPRKSISGRSPPPLSRPNHPPYQNVVQQHRVDRATSADLRPQINGSAPDGAVFRHPRKHQGPNSASLYETANDSMFQGRAESLCGKCERRDATIGCDDCREYFCQSCHDQVHQGRLRQHAASPLRARRQPSTQQAQAARKPVRPSEADRPAVAANTKQEPVLEPRTNVAAPPVSSPGSGSFPRGQTRYCEEHEGERLTLFCVPCQTIVCAHCLLLGDHKGHECVSLKAAYSDCHQKVANQLGLIQENAAIIESSLTGIEQLVRDVTNEAQSAQVAVRGELDQLRDIIDAKERALLGEIRTAQDTKLRELERVMRKQEGQLRVVDEGIRAARSIIENSDGYSFFASYENVTSQLGDILNAKPDLGVGVTPQFTSKVSTGAAANVLQALTFDGGAPVAEPVQVNGTRPQPVRAAEVRKPAPVPNVNHVEHTQQEAPARRAPVRSPSRGYDDDTDKTLSKSAPTPGTVVKAKSDVPLQGQPLFAWDATTMGSGFRLSNDNRTCVALSSFLQSVRSGSPFTSGLHYWELLIDKVAVCTWVGVVGPESDMFSFMGRSEDGAAYSSAGTVLQKGEITSKVDGPRYQSGDTVSCFLNMEARTLTFGINSVGVLTLTNLGPEVYPAISMPHPGQVTLLKYESL